MKPYGKYIGLAAFCAVLLAIAGPIPVIPFAIGFWLFLRDQKAKPSTEYRGHGRETYEEVKRRFEESQKNAGSDAKNE